jgi:hypothetical protein
MASFKEYVRFTFMVVNGIFWVSLLNSLLVHIPDCFSDHVLDVVGVLACAGAWISHPAQSLSRQLGEWAVYDVSMFRCFEQKSLHSNTNA